MATGIDPVQPAGTANDLYRVQAARRASSGTANVQDLYAGGGNDTPARLPGQPSESVEAARNEIFSRRSGNDAYTQRQRSRIETEIREATIPDLNARSLAANRSIQRRQLTNLKTTASEEETNAGNRSAADNEGSDRLASAASGSSQTRPNLIGQMKAGYLDNANTTPSVAKAAPKIETKLDTINVSNSINEIRDSLRGGSAKSDAIAAEAGLPESRLGKNLDITI